MRVAQIAYKNGVTMTTTKLKDTQPMFFAQELEGLNSYDKAILEGRIVYETANLKNPNRWSRKIRNCDQREKVYLSYLQELKVSAINKVS